MMEIRHAKEITQIKLDHQREVKRIEKENTLEILNTIKRLEEMEKGLSVQQECNKQLTDKHEKATRDLSEERESKQKLIEEHNKAKRNLKVERLYQERVRKTG